jgi:tetratricopeptide (TPR) repeat protein
MKAFADGNYPEARAALLKALAKKPSDKDLLYFTALAYQRDFILDSAYYYIRRAFLLHPDNRELVEELYNIASVLGEYRAAREAIDKLIAMGDPLEMHIENLVDVLDKSGSIVNTFYYLRRWYLNFGLDNKGRFRLLATLAVKVDSFEVAHEVLDSAITRWGDSDDYLLVRSQILFGEQRHPEAEAILRDLVSSYPDNVNFKMNLASALSNQRVLSKMDEALVIMREVRTVAPNPTKLDSMIIVVEEHREALLNPSAEPQ